MNSGCAVGELLDLNFSLWLMQFQMPALLPLGTPQWLSAPHTLLTALMGRRPSRHCKLQWKLSQEILRFDSLLSSPLLLSPLFCVCNALVDPHKYVFLNGPSQGGFDSLLFIFLHILVTVLLHTTPLRGRPDSEL